MRILLLFIAIGFVTSAHAVKDKKLTHDADLIAAMDGAGQGCVKYALRNTGAALATFIAINADADRAHKDAWRRLTFTRYNEACLAEVAREIEGMARQDVEEGKDVLESLSPLYVISGPPLHVDVVVELTSMNYVKLDGKEILLRDFLDKIWLNQWKDVVVAADESKPGMWCLLHVAYASGARFHVRNGDKWPRLSLNAGTGEKGTAQTINQCLSGDIGDETPVQ